MIYFYSNANLTMIFTKHAHHVDKSDMTGYKKYLNDTKVRAVDHRTRERRGQPLHAGLVGVGVHERGGGGGGVHGGRGGGGGGALPGACAVAGGGGGRGPARSQVSRQAVRS